MRARKYLLNNFPNLTLKNIDNQIAEEAARINAKHDSGTPASIQMATSIASEADVFITNDHALKKVKDIQVKLLSEIIGASSGI